MANKYTLWDPVACECRDSVGCLGRGLGGWLRRVVTVN